MPASIVGYHNALTLFNFDDIERKSVLAHHKNMLVAFN